MNKHLVSKEDLDALVDFAYSFKEAAMNSYYATDVGLQNSEQELNLLLKKLGYNYD